MPLYGAVIHSQSAGHFTSSPVSQIPSPQVAPPPLGTGGLLPPSSGEPELFPAGDDAGAGVSDTAGGGEDSLVGSLSEAGKFLKRK